MRWSAYRWWQMDVSYEEGSSVPASVWLPFGAHIITPCSHIYLTFRLKHSNHFHYQQTKTSKAVSYALVWALICNTKWVYLFSTTCFCSLVMKFPRKERNTFSFWEAWRKVDAPETSGKKLERSDLTEQVSGTLSETRPGWGHRVPGSLRSSKACLGLCCACWQNQPSTQLSVLHVLPPALHLVHQ